MQSLPDSIVTCPCTTGGLIDLIGKKWTLCIVIMLGNQPGVRFNELQTTLGVSPRTLSDTLKALQDQGFVERIAYAEIPPRVEYQLTGEGLKLRDAAAPLMEFAASQPNACCV